MTFSCLAVFLSAIVTFDTAACAGGVSVPWLSPLGDSERWLGTGRQCRTIVVTESKLTRWLDFIAFKEDVGSVVISNEKEDEHQQGGAEGSPSTSSDPGHPSMVARASAVVTIAAVCVALGAALFCKCRPEQGDDSALSWSICYIQMLSIGGAGFGITGQFVVLSGAFDMMVSLGFDATASGFIIGGYYGLAVPAMLSIAWLAKPWHQPFCVKVCVCAVIVTGSAQLCFTATALTSSSISGPVCLALMMVMRMVMGSTSSIITTIAKLMAQKVTPKAKMVDFQIQFSSASVLGMALGPLLSSAVCVATGARSPSSRIGYPCAVIGLLYLAMVPFLLCLPRDLGPLIRAKEKEDASLTKDVRAQAVADDHEATLAAQKTIWWAAVLYDTERMFSQVAIEVAASLILEIEFGWRQTTIGWMVAAAFMMSVPMSEVFLIARRSFKLSDSLCAWGSSLLGAVATLLLWPGFGLRLTGSDVVTLFLGEVLIFPAFRISKGIMDSVSVEYAIPNTFYSQENCMIVQKIGSHTFGRFLAAPLARWVIRDHGRLSYMTLQLCVNCIGCVTVFKAMRAVQFMDRAPWKAAAAVRGD